MKMLRNERDEEFENDGSCEYRYKTFGNTKDFGKIGLHLMGKCLGRITSVKAT